MNNNRLLHQTATANMSGSPAISSPLPIAIGQLPTGWPLIGQRGADAQLLNIALAIEKYLVPLDGSF